VTTFLYNWQQASKELDRLRDWLKPHMLAGQQFRVIGQAGAGGESD
jgi:hypothetical protein